MKTVLSFILFYFLIYQSAFSAENITINTKSADFFENFISDTTLLLDSEVKNIISNNYINVVNNSRFAAKVNSWRPQPSPKSIIKSIYNNINTDNIGQSLSDLVQPIVELSCSSKQYDPLSNLKTKCINDTLKYPIVEDIKLIFEFNQSKSIDQYISDISHLNNSNRYQQMIITTAGIINRAHANITKTNISKNVIIIKKHYPFSEVTDYADASVKNDKSAPADVSSADSVDKANKIAKCKTSCEREYDICGMVANQDGYTQRQKIHLSRECKKSGIACNEQCDKRFAQSSIFYINASP